MTTNVADHEVAETAKWFQMLVASGYLLAMTALGLLIGGVLGDIWF